MQSLLAFYAGTNLISFNVTIGYLLANFMCSAFLVVWSERKKAAIMTASFLFSIHIFLSTYCFSSHPLKIAIATGFALFPYLMAAVLFYTRRKAARRQDGK